VKAAWLGQEVKEGWGFSKPPGGVKRTVDDSVKTWYRCEVYVPRGSGRDL
jgi:hypothetical protein